MYKAIRVANETEQRQLLQLLGDRGYRWYGDKQLCSVDTGNTMGAPMQVIINYPGKGEIAQTSAEEGYETYKFDGMTLGSFLGILAGASHRIEELIKAHSVHIDDVRVLCSVARNQRRVQKNWVDENWYNSGTDEDWKVVYHADGSIVCGCQSFKWGEVDEFARKQGWWV